MVYVLQHRMRWTLNFHSFPLSSSRLSSSLPNRTVHFEFSAGNEHVASPKHSHPNPYTHKKTHAPGRADGTCGQGF